MQCLKSVTVLSSPVIVLDENKRKNVSAWEALDPSLAVVWTDGSAPGADAPPTVKPRPVRLVHSLFPHKRPTVFFDYPVYIGEDRWIECAVGNSLVRWWMST